MLQELCEGQGTQTHTVHISIQTHTHLVYTHTHLKIHVCGATDTSRAVARDESINTAHANSICRHTHTHRGV